MELSHEEQAELEQLRRQRWNWLGVVLLGVVLVIAGAASGNGGGSTVMLIGVVVGVLGAVMRGRATKRVQLVEARVRDRAAGQTPA